ncbi:MAG: hypothetical protein MUF00_02135 [Gemmatimonadaceae bacterium]|nr:hypothetical protein [Gemmatimonadaceae bacterium]
MRATIVASADAPGEYELLDAWLETWGPMCAQVSTELGCGCCVHIREVDAPAAALAALPAHLWSPAETG